MGSVHIFPAAEYPDRLCEYINRSQTHECGIWDCGCTIPFLGIFFSNFRYWFFSVWERYNIYYLHMEGVCSTGLQFQTFAVFGSIEAHVYLPAHVWRAMGTGVRYSLTSYDPIPGFLPAVSRWRICLLTCITITAPKITITAPKMLSFP
jgi:hypothetical protein